MARRTRGITTGLVLVMALGALACGSSSGPNGSTPSDGGTSAGDSTAPPHGDGGTSADTGGSPGDGGGGGSEGGDAGESTGLHVVLGSGGAPGHIVDGSGKVVQLHGADRSGTEYSCLNGSFFDGPVDQTAVSAMKAWNINAVRVPLNEDCWLGINGVASAYGGAKYQTAISGWVDLLTQNGMVVILDLHWTAPGTTLSNAQEPMADADHAPTFWSQVATMFKGNGTVIFDLFNEPFISDWDCWLKGGTCAHDNNGASFTSAGMATLLKAVRTAGAENVVLMGGLGYSSDFTMWASEVNGIPALQAPLDGLSIANISASWHQYDFGNTGCPSQYNGYSTSSQCDTGQVTANSAHIPSVLAAGFPFLLSESGISAYQTSTPFSAAQVTELETWYDDFLTWVEGQDQGYLAWDWNTGGAPYLLTDYDGTPTPGFGVTYKAHLAKY